MVQIKNHPFKTCHFDLFLKGWENKYANMSYLFNLRNTNCPI